MRAGWAEAVCELHATLEACSQDVILHTRDEWLENLEHAVNSSTQTEHVHVVKAV